MARRSGSENCARVFTRSRRLIRLRGSVRCIFPGDPPLPAASAASPAGGRRVRRRACTRLPNHRIAESAQWLRFPRTTSSAPVRPAACWRIACQPFVAGSLPRSRNRPRLDQGASRRRVWWPIRRSAWGLKPGLNNRRLAWPRGKLVGGTSCMATASIYMRGTREDFDTWRDAGNPGCRWAPALQAGGASDLHGVSGELRASLRSTSRTRRRRRCCRPRATSASRSTTISTARRREASVMSS